MAQAKGFPPYLLLKFVVPWILPQVLNGRKSIERALCIGDQRLQDEIHTCEALDEDYAPYMDRIRTIAGLEYEYRLQRELQAAKILFEVEDDLRGLGYSKTPDALLTFPISISLEEYDDEPHVIRWIDSKAMFGDYKTHCEDHKDQFASYVNRFGEGLVIYWFGYDQSVAMAHKGVYVVNDFPRLGRIEKL